MAKLYAVSEEELQAIGDAIRTKRDITTPIEIENMPLEINLIDGGGSGGYGFPHAELVKKIEHVWKFNELFSISDINRSSTAAQTLATYTGANAPLEEPFYLRDYIPLVYYQYISDVKYTTADVPTGHAITTRVAGKSTNVLLPKKYATGHARVTESTGAYEYVKNNQSSLASGSYGFYANQTPTLTITNSSWVGDEFQGIVTYIQDITRPNITFRLISTNITADSLDYIDMENSTIKFEEWLFKVPITEAYANPTFAMTRYVFGEDVDFEKAIKGQI